MTIRDALARAAPPLRRVGRALPPRRVLLLAMLAFFGASCVRPLPLGLQPPGPAAYGVAEEELALPASVPGSHMEGYLLRPEVPDGTRIPCAVLLHGKGGYWRAYTRYGRELAARGIAALVLNYYSVHQVDLEGWKTPFTERKESFEAQNEDIVRATARFAQGPLCAGGKVAVVGFSLGADKAIRAAAALPEVAAVAAYYGPYDYVSFIHVRVNAIVLALASEDLLRWKKYLEEASPIRLVPKIRAPVFLLHGVEDAVIPVEQSLQMTEALRRRGGKFRIHFYEGAGHNFVLRRGPSEVRDDSVRRVIAFLQEHLPAEGRAPAAEARKEGGAPSSPPPGAGG
ncbi:MAG: dienelactone hydrolase family protein [Candidatus Tectomicrobia bacterium]|uniref:Dienelactone hydrolase family protein n=1 Tax=Tectimicrobiota bacterium TaxID=2528274 RepID=A0A933E9I4_UNCTE|nr:dienelactone hydrolase family protein [Candidatus Tectomicrobia bacterium]MBI2177288.1 dienelactone hydrolase family protein [Candidatus Tectomicrobia bacterium]MBI4252128.1 dienelactone hydrolase family protein [Candidatus Tectomicrobia bacterium]